MSPCHTFKVQLKGLNINDVDGTPLWTDDYYIQYILLGLSTNSLTILPGMPIDPLSP